jgi:hypothetical protein
LCSLYLVLNVPPSALCILMGTVGISFYKCHFCYIYLFVSKVLICFVLCSDCTCFLIYDWPWLCHLENELNCCSVDHCWSLNMDM